jgi:hypothetical protein
MNKYLISIVLFLAVTVISSCERKTKTGGVLAIAFYNVENLFDTINSPGINDGKYTPESDFNWDSKKYMHKLDQLSRVIAAMDTLNDFPAIIGLSEVENFAVVKDLASHPSLAKAGYKIVHKDSPDGRGIDVAMLYREKYFRPIENHFIHINLPDSGRATRDILYSKGLLAGTDTVHLFFNHWVSRWGGQEKTEASRIATAALLKHITDSIMGRNPRSEVIIAGDLNDNPTDTSVYHVLKARKPLIPLRAKSLYNLSLAKFENGEGSLYYKSWDMFDQFIVSSALFDTENIIHLMETDQRIIKYDWMLYKPKKGEARPNRTATSKYYGGFSDHLPVMIYLTTPN